MAEPRDDPVALDSICDLVSDDEVDSITGLTLDLHTSGAIASGPPYGRCSWEPPDGNVVAASISARPLRKDGVSTPEEWWTRNLEPLKNAVIAVEPLPAFGDHGYLATDDTTVDVLWFPDATTYVEARVYSTGWVNAPPPPMEELERMVLELSDLFAERLEPHLPLPDPEVD